jgi:phospholipase/carboxylesterase
MRWRLPDVALAAPQAPGMTWWPTSFLAPAAQMEPFVERGWRRWMRLWTLL